MTISNDKLTVNDRKVLEVLSDGEPRDRPTICKDANIAWTSAFDSLDRLMLKGLVEKWRVKGDHGRSKNVYSIVINYDDDDNDDGDGDINGDENRSDNNK